MSDDVLDGKRGLIRKLAEVAGTVDRIPKRGHNAHFGYDYVTEADVADAVRKEFSERHLVMYPDVLSTELLDGKFCLLNIKWTLVDGETGETLSYHIPGMGQDSGDKGPYKAITGSQKYAVMKLLQLSTGDDPERDSGGDGKATAGKAPKRASAFNRSPEAQAQRREEAVEKAPYREREAKSDWGRTQVLMKKWPAEIAAIIPPDEATYKKPEPEADANRDFYIDGIRTMTEARKLSDDEIATMSLMFLGAKTAQLDDANTYVLRAIWKYMDPERA